MKEKRRKSETEEPKEKRQKTDSFEAENVDSQELSYEEKLRYVNGIAKPMLAKKAAKKVFKLMKKAYKHKKDGIRVGLKPVQYGIRKSERGIVIIAGDVSPLDVICHIPGVCEDCDIPYAYVPSRTDIAAGLGITRKPIIVLIKHMQDYSELFEECKAEVNKLPFPC